MLSPQAQSLPRNCTQTAEHWSKHKKTKEPSSANARSSKTPIPITTINNSTSLVCCMCIDGVSGLAHRFLPIGPACAKAPYRGVAKLIRIEPKHGRKWGSSTNSFSALRLKLAPVPHGGRVRWAQLAHRTSTGGRQRERWEESLKKTTLRECCRLSAELSTPNAAAAAVQGDESFSLYSSREREHDWR